MPRIQRHDDGLEVGRHPDHEEFAARIVADREAVVGQAVALLARYLRLDRRGFDLDTITVPSADDARLSFTWTGAEAPEEHARFDVVVAADLRPVGFCVHVG